MPTYPLTPLSVTPSFIALDATDSFGENGVRLTGLSNGNLLAIWAEDSPTNGSVFSAPAAIFHPVSLPSRGRNILRARAIRLGVEAEVPQGRSEH